MTGFSSLRLRPAIGTAGAPAEARPAGSGAVWISCFLLLFGMLAAWSLATPVYGAPDEPMHAYRAASLVRGQLLGQDVSTPGNPSVLVEVPSALVSVRPDCYQFRSWVPASCMRTTPQPAGLVPVTTYTGRYPPLYGLIVGLPSLLPLGSSMLLWMRLAGDVVNALFLTVGFVQLTRRRRSWWAIAGGAVAMTPLVLFIGAVINPNGLEIAAAFAMWCTLLGWATGPRQPDRSTVVWAAAAAVTLESSRGLSPAFALLVVIACALVAGRERVRRAARRRDVRLAGTTVAAFGVLAVVWVLAAGSLRLLAASNVPPGMGTGSLVAEVLGRAVRFPGFVGKFGWLDTPSPGWVVTVWAITGAVLLAGVALCRARRSQATVALVLAAAVLVPVLGDLLQARTVGVVSQPRYILPVAVGIVLIAGTAIRWHGAVSRTAAQLVAAAVAAGQIGAFTWVLRRYRTGVGPRVRPGLPEWSPPLGTGVLTAVLVLAQAGFLLWLWQRGRAGDRQQVVRPAAPMSAAGQLE